jgi:hypothetical protein
MSIQPPDRRSPQMKKLLTLTLAGLALALPATAMAGGCAFTLLTHVGSDTSSRAAKGSCITRKLDTSLVLRCDGSTGYAVARYDFRMPDSWSGTPSANVNSLGDPLGQPTVVKLDDNHVRVIVRISGPSRVVVAGVSLGFYS